MKFRQKARVQARSRKGKCNVWKNKMAPTEDLTVSSAPIPDFNVVCSSSYSVIQDAGNVHKVFKPLIAINSN